MSHHKEACCLLQLCCTGRKQREALAALIAEAPSPQAAADKIMSLVDFVPPGVGAMIRNTYGPFYTAMALEAAVTAKNPEAKGTPDGKA